MSLLQQVTADVTVGGTLIHWPPEAYRVMLHLFVENPLPATGHLHKVQLRANQENLEGNVLYHYNHEVDPSKYVVPGNSVTMLDFELSAFEVAIPTDLQEIGRLMKEAAHQEMNA